MTSLSAWAPLFLVVCGGGIGAGLRYLAGLGVCAAEDQRAVVAPLRPDFPFALVT